MVVIHIENYDITTIFIQKHHNIIVYDVTTIFIYYVTKPYDCVSILFPFIQFVLLGKDFL